jgi:predicted acyltransferase
MIEPSAAPPRRTLLVIALVMVAASIGIGYAGFTRSPRLYAPPAVAYLVALIFIVTAARLLEMASGRAGRGDWFALVFFGASALAIYCASRLLRRKPMGHD